MHTMLGSGMMALVLAGALAMPAMAAESATGDRPCAMVDDKGGMVVIGAQDMLGTSLSAGRMKREEMQRRLDMLEQRMDMLQRMLEGAVR